MTGAFELKVKRSTRWRPGLREPPKGNRGGCSEAPGLVRCTETVTHSRGPKTLILRVGPRGRGRGEGEGPDSQKKVVGPRGCSAHVRAARRCTTTCHVTHTHNTRHTHTHELAMHACTFAHTHMHAVVDFWTVFCVFIRDSSVVLFLGEQGAASPGRLWGVRGVRAGITNTCV